MEADSGQTLNAEILALAHGGAFIGKIDSPQSSLDGKKVLVRNVVPGEKVKIKLIRDSKKLSWAEVEEIYSSSPDRKEPECPYFGCCGGCDLQHISLTRQRLLKKEMVGSTLLYQAGFSPRSAIKLIGEDLPGYHYRNRISLHCDREGKIGFFKPKSGQVVDIERCILANEQINSALLRLRSFARACPGLLAGAMLEQHSEGLFLIIKLTDKAELSKLMAKDSGLEDLQKYFAALKISFQEKELYRFDNPTYPAYRDLPFGHFSQINSRVNKLLNQLVLESCASDRITELYAGAGNFTLALAQAGKTIDAVEIDPDLVRYGELLAAQNKLSNRIRFHHTSAEKFVKHNSLNEILLLDPPRSGAKRILQTCTTNKVKVIVYVSCDLPSLARDLRILSEQGFLLEDTYLLDMFPNTHHVETVSLIKRA